MIGPFVGLPTEGHGCAFSAHLDVPACGASSTLHIISEAPGWGPVSLESCAEHEPLARAAGAVMAEHEYGAVCAAGTCWADTP